MTKEEVGGLKYISFLIQFFCILACWLIGVCMSYVEQWGEDANLSLGNSFVKLIFLIIFPLHFLSLLMFL